MGRDSVCREPRARSRAQDGRFGVVRVHPAGHATKAAQDAVGDAERASLSGSAPLRLNGGRFDPPASGSSSSGCAGCPGRTAFRRGPTWSNTTTFCDTPQAAATRRRHAVAHHFIDPTEFRLRLHRPGREARIASFAMWPATAPDSLRSPARSG
jgi:hypothetical protein